MTLKKPSLEILSELKKKKRTLVMGVLNVTPNSFSDGGMFLDTSRAIDRGLALVREGADIVDVGGIATSPGSKPATEEEELLRVVPVIEGLKKYGITISIDTSRAAVARQALLSGASWINDQSAGLFDKKMADVMPLADAIVLMHNGGGCLTGVDAGEQIVYNDVVEEVTAFFKERIESLSIIGVPKSKIVVDPGVGFGKGLKDSLAIINNMQRFNGLGALSMLGVSRKSFIGKITGILDPNERDFASLGATAAAIVAKTDIIRTHNVRATVEMARVLDLCVSNMSEGERHENLH